eukprot:CAMPEP_0173389684 /NCGR_PEP_ID=MMETSP1356-20130122/13029_1 /TAXON_ID=77927 ORGANISM="Hemiselmis virescens, Strain PCC157" /NCGR_SAMPLE_ID=MMETSP1356 /ASSEMBLY_ACC=CAM_ASM_000847 /LENGTH=124 /DNA_ID=CAMNT_0014346911 /DNA_START=24 /DNA_END=398 /DNA_ORIENTATION=-
MSKNYADPQASANFEIPNSGKKDDPMTNFSRKEKENRQAWISIMRTRDIRHQLRECFRREGVNHVENCREFALAYIEAISQPNTTSGIDPIRKGMEKREAARVAAGEPHEPYLPMPDSYRNKKH